MKLIQIKSPGKKYQVYATLNLMRSLLPNNRAFTLIEVLVALSIIAIVSVVALPNFKRFSASQDITSASSNVLNMLRRAQSDAVSGIRCSTNVGPNAVPRPSYSFNVRFTAASMIATQYCINSTPTGLDYVAPPILDIAPVFAGTVAYVDSPNAATLPTVGPTASSTCTSTGGTGYVSFRGSQVYFSCTAPTSPTDYCLLPNTVALPKCPVASNYVMTLHDSRNVSTDEVLTISSSGVIGVSP